MTLIDEVSSLSQAHSESAIALRAQRSCFSDSTREQNEFPRHQVQSAPSFGHVNPVPLHW